MIDTNSVVSHVSYGIMISALRCVHYAAQAYSYMLISKLIPLVNAMCNRSSKVMLIGVKERDHLTVCVWVKNIIDSMLPSTAYEYHLSSPSCW